MEKANSMKVGIVTVTYNSRNVLGDFLSSVECQIYRDRNLYIVDSGSTDGTSEFVQAHLPSGGRYFTNDANIGFAAGMNQGIRAALDEGCTAILAVNNDVVFGPNLIVQLVQSLVYRECEMTAPIMYFNDSKDVIWSAGGSFRMWRGYLNAHRGMGEKDVGQYSTEEKVAFAPLCCVLIRSEVFERIGLLDERFFTYAEDADFMYRCMEKGISLWYVPDAKLWHKVSSLTGTMSDFTIRYSVRGRIYFLHKHFSPPLAWFWTLAHFMGFAVQLMLRKESRRVVGLKCRAAMEGYRVYSQTESAHFELCL